MFEFDVGMFLGSASGNCLGTEEDLPLSGTFRAVFFRIFHTTFRLELKTFRANFALQGRHANKPEAF